MMYSPRQLELRLPVPYEVMCEGIEATVEDLGMKSSKWHGPLSGIESSIALTTFACLGAMNLTPTHKTNYTLKSGVWPVNNLKLEISFYGEAKDYIRIYSVSADKILFDTSRFEATLGNNIGRIIGREYGTREGMIAYLSTVFQYYLKNSDPERVPELIPKFLNIAHSVGLSLKDFGLDL